MRPIIAIAKTTVGEAIRRKVLLIILLLAVALLFIAPGLNMLSARQETTVLRAFTLGIIQIAAIVIAIILTVYLIPNEIERRTIYTILSKPVQRYHFVVGKFLGAVAALGMMVVFMSFILIVVNAVQTRSFNGEEVAMLLKAPIMNFFQAMMLASVAMFVSTFAPPIINIFVSGGVFLMGSVFGSFFATLLESRQTSGLAKGMATIVQTILPNFSLFNVHNPIINPTQTITNETAYMVSNIGYSLFYCTVMIALACFMFENREV